jgi:hypothetical protein
VIGYIEVCTARAQMAVSNRSFEQILTALYKLESKGVIDMCSMLPGKGSALMPPEICRAS